MAKCLRDVIAEMQDYAKRFPKVNNTCVFDWAVDLAFLNSEMEYAMDENKKRKSDVEAILDDLTLLENTIIAPNDAITDTVWINEYMTAVDFIEIIKEKISKIK